MDNAEIARTLDAYAALLDVDPPDPSRPADVLNTRPLAEILRA